MSRCPNCGKNLPLLYTHCDRCGVKIPESIVKENRGKSAALIIVGVILIIMISIGLNREPDIQESSESQNKGLEISANVSLGIETEDDTDVTEVQIETVTLGTPVNAENLICNVTDWYFTDTLGRHEADADKSFLVVKTSVKNEDVSAKRMQDFLFYILYQDKYKYNATFLSSDEYIQYHDTIIPLETIEGVLAFQVPKELEKSNDLKLVVTKNKIDCPFEYHIKLNK